MFAFLYFTFWSILLLVADVLLRSAGLTIPLLGFFFAAASYLISARMALCFALVFGIAMDFVLGYVMPWDGILLPLLTLPAFFLHGKHPDSDVLEFLAGAMIPSVMTFPHIWISLTTPEGFASLLMSCLFGAFLFPVTIALVARSARRLEIGAAAKENGGA